MPKKDYELQCNECKKYFVETVKLLEFEDPIEMAHGKCPHCGCEADHFITEYL